MDDARKAVALRLPRLEHSVTLGLSQDPAGASRLIIELLDEADSLAAARGYSKSWTQTVDLWLDPNEAALKARWQHRREHGPRLTCDMGEAVSVQDHLQGALFTAMKDCEWRCSASGAHQPLEDAMISLNLAAGLQRQLAGRTRSSGITVQLSSEALETPLQLVDRRLLVTPDLPGRLGEDAGWAGSLLELALDTLDG